MAIRTLPEEIDEILEYQLPDVSREIRGGTKLRLLEAFLQAIERAKPGGKDANPNENAFPDARWQRENFGATKYNQAINDDEANLRNEITAKQPDDRAAVSP
jgi:hypothetical protein